MNNSSLPEKLDKNWESVKLPSEGGPITVHSHLSEHQVEKDYTPSDTSSKQINIKATNKQPRKKSATAESLPKVKKTTSRDKFTTCKTNFQTTKSSLILPRESTSNETGCVPFWKWQVEEPSKKLWLPTEIDCADSHSNWSNGSFTPTASNSWFSIKTWNPQNRPSLPKTSCLSSTYSIAESMERENTKDKKKRMNTLRKSSKNPANKVKKVRLNPKPEDAAIIKKWFGSARSTYNWALACINEKPNEYRKTDLVWLRKRFINKCNIPKSKQYLLDTPKQVRDTAITDLSQGFKTNFKIKKENPNHYFKMKFRSKKDNQSITLDSRNSIRSWDTENNEMKMYPTFLKNKIKFHTRKNRSLPDKLDYDCKLLLDKLGRIYLIIVYHEEACENQTGTKPHDWCSIDPGVRTMLTVYSPDQGVCFKIGDKDMNRIFRLCKCLDHLISRCAKSKMQKKKLKIPILRMRMRISNLVTEVHCKSIHLLVNTFNNIIIPSFCVSQMIKHGNRKLNSKSVRQMVTWRHFGFRQRLIQTAKRYNVNVFVRGEEYTSKTCTHCQNIKHDLNGAKHYKCDNCGLVGDRDACGARNIFLKNTVVNP